MRIGKQYFWKPADYWILAGSFIPAGILTWGVHELAHYLMGMALGYDMWITFNQAGPTQGHFDSQSHRVLVDMVGPIITWVQAVLAFFIIRWSRELWVYSFLFLTFWTRALAMVVSIISNPNDEARASIILGLPLWAIPAFSIGLLFALTFFASRYLNVGWKGNLTAYAAASLVTAAIVYSDQAIFVR